MNMKWLVISVIICLPVADSQQGSPVATGSCASINYSNRCCPPSLNRIGCIATDGGINHPCGCDTLCHTFRDCCETDSNCTRDPRTCADIGITECCTDRSGHNPGTCEVRDRNNVFVCSCNASCHERRDCCQDAAAIGCKPSCSPERQPGCCTWGPASSCYVSGQVGDGCYCDSYCIVFGDCCKDVQLPSCTATLSTWSGRNNAQKQSYLQQDLLHAVHIQQYDLKRPWTPPTHTGYYHHHRMALTARTQRIRTNAREFRGRARARVAARPPAYYNYDYNY